MSQARMLDGLAQAGAHPVGKLELMPATAHLL
jgi:hypothetical protein